MIEKEPQKKRIRGTNLGMGIEMMQAAGIDDEQIILLVCLKHQIAIGDRSDVTNDYKRLEFYRFLIETNRLSDELPIQVPIPDISLPAYDPSTKLLLPPRFKIQC